MQPTVKALWKALMPALLGAVGGLVATFYPVGHAAFCSGTVFA